MCGIAGILDRDPARGLASDGELLGRMGECLAHRGPDDAGAYTAPGVALVHRRLAVIDPEGSRQPISNEDGSIWLVYNGETYNFRSLRQDLMAKGHTFRTAGDTEVLVHLYEEEGPDLVRRINGMFAFALWDANRRRLMLARDRLGIKPLYWTEAGGALLFASEVKALLQAAEVPRRLNRPALAEYLSHTEVYGEETLFEGIHRLPPGRFMLATEDFIERTRYWQVQPRHLGLDSPAKAARALEDRLREAVRLRLVSDVPLGVFLSGGVDSSLLASLASEVAGEGIQTFSIGFESDAFDERPYAQLAALHVGAEHSEYTLGEREFCDELPRAVWHRDAPLKHHACVPLMVLARYAKGRATVILSGEGADEVFLGYRKYRLARWHRWLNVAARPVPRFLLRAAAHVGRRVFPGKLGTKVLPRLAVRDPARLAELYGADLGAEMLGLFGLEAHPGRRSAFVRAFRASPLARMDQRHSQADLATYLQSLLAKQDTMTMAAGIETRVPLLDHRVVEFGLNLPLCYKIHGGEGKVLLKRVAARRLPHELIYRKKMGFPVPLTEWLSRDGPFRRLVIDVLTDPSTRGRGYFDYTHFESHLADVAGGRWGTGPDAAAVVWALLNFELWHRQFLDVPRPFPPETPLSRRSFEDFAYDADRWQPVGAARGQGPGLLPGPGGAQRHR